MALYGIIIHWTATEEFGNADYFFISRDAETYYEVECFPGLHDDETAAAHEARLREWEDPGPNGDGSVTLRMSFDRRYFSQEEHGPGRGVTFDGRIWPPVREKPDGTRPAHIEAGLPPEVRYPKLEEQKPGLISADYLHFPKEEARTD